MSKLGYLYSYTQKLNPSIALFRFLFTYGSSRFSNSWSLTLLARTKLAISLSVSSLILTDVDKDAGDLNVVESLQTGDHEAVG